MYRPVQYPVFVLHDLLAMTCMILTLSAARGAAERRRSLTVASYLIAAAVSGANIALLGLYVDSLGFDKGFLVYGAVSLIPILVLPQVVLRTSKRLVCALICLTVNIGMEGLFSVFGYVLDNPDGFRYHFLETIFCAAGYAAVAAFMYYCAKKNDLQAVRSTVELIPKWLYVVIIVCSFSSFFSVMGDDPELYSFEKASAILRALSVFGVILFVGWFVIKVFSLMAKQNRILAQMNAMQSNYESLMRSDEQIRRFRHDFKNHMIVVTSLLSAGRTDDAADYLKGVDSTFGVTARRFSTGNFAADAILAAKLPAAEEAGIELTFSGVIPDEGVESADICAVVGNLVDNALEATVRYTGKRYVRVKAAVRDGVLTISVVNPVAGPVEIKGNRIKTTKGANHGIGLKNVDDAVKKYGGTMLLSCDEKEFTADAAMKLRTI